MRWIGVLLVITLGLSFQRAEAQSARAMLMSVSYAGVEMRHVNTEAWLPLTAGAQLPITEGDAIRTRDGARARIALLDAGEVLLLPFTTLEIDTLAGDDTGQIDLQLRMNGVLVFDVQAPERFSRFSLLADALTVDRPASRFAVRAIANVPPSLIVADGEAFGRVGDESVTVEAGYGWRADHAPLPIDAPANFARLDAMLDGCPGVVDTIEDVDLRVRVGATTLYYPLGAFPEGSPVTLLGITEDRRYFRVQYLSAYGWVERLAVDTECANLPIYPNESVEVILRLPLPQPEEIALLTPFYGQPQDDPWFYNLFPLR